MNLILIVETKTRVRAPGCSDYPGDADSVEVTSLIEREDTSNHNWHHLLTKFPLLHVEAVIVAPNRIVLKMHNCLK
jgi:hypothetical protein